MGDMSPKSFKMSWLNGRATSQNFAEFAQNLYTCKLKLEKSRMVTIFICFFLHVLTLLVFFFWLPISCAKFSKKIFR